ncbi:hypothetical protein POM88_049174 [Heracleum sosnowskyi]|uniref:Protein FAR1-RELATED SEQUENCE n=1 Tax=Heracleum sosnowskyi TaxID=360622 RepID=A0AAD8GXR6_9APIA|nr:hypothetical protein POM88_049174 [Heracleum sosnowskyi]
MNKFPGKIGPVLSSNKKFMDKMKSVVSADHLTQDEFEEDVEMVGLLRTTSRSESSNFYFQHFHESGDTLVEFYSSFESAMDRQQSADDDNKSEPKPLTVTTMKIEGDASKQYTQELYYLQCSVDIIPPQYVKPRWTKFASKRHSILGSTKVSDQCAKRARTKVKKTTTWFEFQTCIKNAGEDEFKVDVVITGLKNINSGLKDSSSTSTLLGGAQIVDKFIGPLRQSNIL